MDEVQDLNEAVKPKVERLHRQESDLQDQVHAYSDRVGTQETELRRLSAAVHEAVEEHQRKEEHTQVDLDALRLKAEAAKRHPGSQWDARANRLSASLAQQRHRDSFDVQSEALSRELGDLE